MPQSLAGSLAHKVPDNAAQWLPSALSVCHHKHGQGILLEQWKGVDADECHGHPCRGEIMRGRSMEGVLDTTRIIRKLLNALTCCLLAYDQFLPQHLPHP